MAGLLASLDLLAFSSRKTGTMALRKVSHYPDDHRDGVTVAGTAPVFHRIPF